MKSIHFTWDQSLVDLKERGGQIGRVIRGGLTVLKKATLQDAYIIERRKVTGHKRTDKTAKSVVRKC